MPSGIRKSPPQLNPAASKIATMRRSIVGAAPKAFSGALMSTAAP
jgi:hypothetical protein